MTVIDPPAPWRVPELERAALVAGGLAVIAHHWLWAGPPGVSLAMTLAATGGAAILLNARSDPKRGAIASLILLFAVAPLLEVVSTLSVIVAMTLTALAALVAAGRAPRAPSAALRAVAALAASPVWRLPRDLWRWRRAAARGGPATTPLRSTRRSWRLWLMPLTLSALFTALFAAANPVIEGWLEAVDLVRLFEALPAARLFFILALFAAIWPLLRPARPRRARKAPRVRAGGGSTLFGPAAITRALCLFNAVFAVQTALDIGLLWGGAALPEGVTYAEYAHRGAYPLILTALLAAAFVLLALRPGSAAARSPLIRGLVYLWIAQNALLVASSMMRLDLYVDVYGLTIMRIAAFAWMGLVAAGLFLIVARIAYRRSGEWLIGANLATLGVTLYAFCFVDVTAMALNHNLRSEARLDVHHLMSHGAAAIPAADEALRRIPSYGDEAEWLRQWRRDCAIFHRESMADWRAWTRRDAALLTYLDAHPETPHSRNEAPL